MRLSALALLWALGLPSVAAAQPTAFGSWERPAAGLFAGLMYTGDANNYHAATQLGFVFDMPVAIGWRARADVGRATWPFEQRDYRGALQFEDHVTLEQVSVSAVHISRRSVPQFTPYAGLGYGLYHYGLRATRVRHPWHGGVNALAGLEVTTADGRFAVAAEARIRGIDSANQPPVFPGALFTIDASLGVKVRF